MNKDHLEILAKPNLRRHLTSKSILARQDDRRHGKNFRTDR